MAAVPAAMEWALALLALLMATGATADIPRACSTPETNQFPFCNTQLSVDERVKNLISLLEDAEKPPLLTARMSPQGNVPRIGLPEYDWGANCIHGVQSRCGTKCPTSFPNPNALGATFNMSLVYDMGAVIGLELRSLWLQGVGENHPNNLPHLGLDCWSPNININRDPRWGRNQEVPSEDPFLTAQYGVAYTTGLQNGKLDDRYLQAVVTLKHWDAYSLEDSGNWTRHNFNAVVSPYDFTETYFPAWKASVTEANAKGVMCSYNAVNGIPTCASKFLNNILRGAWGFDGYITSDSGAIQDIYDQHHYVQTLEEAAAVAITAGTDINSGGVYLGHLLNAVQQGLINMSDVDLALYHTLKLRFELGLFDPIENQPYWQVPPDVVNTNESQALNLLATQQSLVLLKNDNNVLPFKKGLRVAVLGPHGNAQEEMVGNYLGQICPGGQYDFSCVVSPFQAITAINAPGNVTFVQGCNINDNDTSGFGAAIAAATEADIVVLAVGLDQSVEGESHDRVSITLPGVQDLFCQAIIAVGKPTAVVLLNGGSVAIEWLAANASSILEAFYPGYQGGTAIASALFGDYNPGGKMPVTVYKADYINQVNFTSMDMTVSPGRGYRYFTGEPLWPFGWGLSYTTFNFSFQNGTTPSVYLDNTIPNSTAVIQVQIENTGGVAGDEVALAFFKPSNESSVLIKKLFGFQRVHLAPGQSTIVQFTVDVTTFGLGDQDGNIISIPGLYSMVISNGVEEALDVPVKIVGAQKILVPFP